MKDMKHSFVIGNRAAYREGAAGPLHPPEISENLLNSTQSKKISILKKCSPALRLLVPKSAFLVPK